MEGIRKENRSHRIVIINDINNGTCLRGLTGWPWGMDKKRSKNSMLTYQELKEKRWVNPSILLQGLLRGTHHLPNRLKSYGGGAGIWPACGSKKKRNAIKS